MTVVTSTDHPEVFPDTPALPAGFHYEVTQVEPYVYGQLNPVYQISVVRESDGAKITGNPFYPDSRYEGVPTMMSLEATNTWNLWNQFYQNDLAATAAVGFIGF